MANTRVHGAFIYYAKRGLDHNVAVGRYVLMPDHIHFFVAGDHEFGIFDLAATVGHDSFHGV